MVRGTFSPARAWRPAVVARLARTLGSTQIAMRCPSRVSACRRKLNSHEAAEPQDVSRPSLGAPEQVVAEQSPIRANLCRCLVHQARGRNGRGKPSAKRHGTAVPDRTTGLRWKRWFSVSSSGRRSQQCQCWPERVRRLECVASHGHQRGAGSVRGRPSKVTGPCQAHRQRSPRAQCCLNSLNKCDTRLCPPK